MSSAKSASALHITILCNSYIDEYQLSTKGIRTSTKQLRFQPRFSSMLLTQQFFFQPGVVNCTSLTMGSPRHPDQVVESLQLRRETTRWSLYSRGTFNNTSPVSGALSLMKMMAELILIKERYKERTSKMGSTQPGFWWNYPTNKHIPDPAV